MPPSLEPAGAPGREAKEEPEWAIEEDPAAQEVASKSDKKDADDSDSESAGESDEDVLPGRHGVEAYVAEQRRQQQLVPITQAPPAPWWFSRLAGWGGVMRFVGLYMALPFVTGVMAGMGEIFANELMFRWGWRGARPVQVPGRGGRVFPVSGAAGQTVQSYQKE
ncbi:hypothetical protein IWQ57_003214 [Coemansia nantahalensis]|uniref:Uncharacterized protein n=1 Tax=Coemansia nantahalensis TaxID=2789366 RepID=A0ACC1JXD7_9FUNG|nr:hypothetical protein IWQ57_003214 [Coemansia nantahalensis]